MLGNGGKSRIALRVGVFWDFDLERPGILALRDRRIDRFLGRCA